MTTLKDMLSHLNYRAAVKLLGSDGVALLRKGGKMQVDLEEQVILADHLIQRRWAHPHRQRCGGAGGSAGFGRRGTGEVEQSVGHASRLSQCRSVGAAVPLPADLAPNVYSGRVER